MSNSSGQVNKSIGRTCRTEDAPVDAKGLGWSDPHFWSPASLPVTQDFHVLFGQLRESSAHQELAETTRPRYPLENQKV